MAAQTPFQTGEIECDLIDQFRWMPNHGPFNDG
jgi:hypothetical protein